LRFICARLFDHDFHTFDKTSTEMRTKDPTRKQRNIRVSNPDNGIFHLILFQYREMGVKKTPDQLADELFSLGLHLKRRNLLNGEIHHEQ
jgi:hypothetical protein